MPSIAASLPSPRHELAELTYLKWIPLYEKEKPFVYLSEVPKHAEDRRQSNFEFHSVRVPITDIRGHESDYTLDRQGFEYVVNPLQLDIEDFNDEEFVERNYLPNVEALLRSEIEDVDDLFIFDWRMRRADYVAQELDMNSKTSFLPTSGNVHVDQSSFQVTRTMNRARNCLGADKVDQYCHGRVRIINVWRPIILGTVEDKPVAVCDGSTCEPADLVTNDIIRSAGHGVREAFALLHREDQKFHYLSQQTKDEVLMIKIFDSKRDVAATCSPHTSFTHSKIRSGAPPRKSIEVRAMVFTRPKTVCKQRYQDAA